MTSFDVLIFVLRAGLFLIQILYWRKQDEEKDEFQPMGDKRNARLVAQRYEDDDTDESYVNDDDTDVASEDVLSLDDGKKFIE